MKSVKRILFAALVLVLAAGVAVYAGEEKMAKLKA